MSGEKRTLGWTRRWLIAAAIGISMMGMWSQAARAVTEEEEEAATPLGTRTTARRTAGALAEQSKIEKKLQQIIKNQEQILANQQTILGRFDAVMEELRIVKVRASAQ